LHFYSTSTQSPLKHSTYILYTFFIQLIVIVLFDALFCIAAHSSSFLPLNC
jgi:hypothetical protein